MKRLGKKSLRRALCISAGALLLTVLSSSCGYFAQYDNLQNAKQLRVGMTKDQVRELMGGDGVQQKFTSDDVWFYYVETRWHDGQSTKDECMPVVFENGKVKGWGHAFYNREQLTRETYERPTIEGLR